MEIDEAVLGAGTGMICISPPFGVELSGYGYYRNRKTDRVQRDLCTRALVIEQGETRLAIITADLIGIPQSITRQTRALVEAQTGIPAENVLIACSHTHSGPATFSIRGCGEVDPGYVGMLPRYLASVVVEAMQEMQPVHVFAGQTTLNGLAMNRVDPLGAFDASVQALEFVDIEASTRIALFSFGCHPVCTLPDDTDICDDFPGRAASLIETHPDYAFALFLQGSCGDVNPTVAHTDIGEMERASRMLAGAAHIAMAQAGLVQNLLPVRCFTKVIELPLNPPTPEELCRKRDDNRALLAEREPDSEEGRRAMVWAEAAESLLMQLTGESDPWLDMLREAWEEISRQQNREPQLEELATYMDLPAEAVARLLKTQQEHETSGANAPKSVSCELQAIQMGDVVLLAHPTELFAEFGLEIKRNSPFPHTFVIGYCNDFLGYIPNEREFQRKGYAAETVPYLLDRFPFAPHVGRVFTDACIQFLNELHEE